MANYIYSTATQDNNYTAYEAERIDGMNVISKQVLIKGGAGLMSKHFVTPQGVATKVSDEDLEFLKSHIGFQDHLKAGFVKIDSRKMDIEKAIGDMNKRDRSAPIVPQDLKETFSNRLGRKKLRLVG